MKKYGSTIGKEEIQEMPIEHFPGAIEVVDTEDALKGTLSFLNQQTIVGFDTETKPAFVKGKQNKVALLQLSTDDVCFLIRINKLGLTKEIIDFLSNKDILKIGLSIKDDFLMLKKKNKDFKADGFVELQELAPKYGMEVLSLQKIYALMFSKKIAKAQRLSNWEAKELSQGQQNYASLDAWACLKIFNDLNK